MRVDIRNQIRGRRSGDHAPQSGDHADRSTVLNDRNQIHEPQVGVLNERNHLEIEGSGRLVLRFVAGAIDG
jgi:hypothetical protein